MQPAFLLRGLFPPPATFTLVLVWQYRAGARLTANADEPAFVQAVVRQFQHPDVAPDFLACHLRQRVELVQGAFRGRERGVYFHHGHSAARARALVAALAGSPGLHARQLATQRLDLADAAAFAMAV